MSGREALLRTWLAANHAHSVAQLGYAPAAHNAAAPNLRELAQRELSTQGRYQLAKPALPSTGEPWWLRAWDWLADRWQHFWDALFGHVHIGTAQTASIGDVLLVGVGLLLVFVLVRLVRDLQFTRRSTSAQVEALSEPPSPRALYNSACEAAGRGDYGTAALLLFAAMVLLLRRRRAIDVTSSATVGDLRRALRARNTALVAPFDAVAAPFVRRAYAERPVTEQQWHSARAAYDSIIR